MAIASCLVRIVTRGESWHSRLFACLLSRRTPLTALRTDGREPPQELRPGQRAELRAQRLGRRHKQATQLAETGPSGRLRAFASSTQCPQRFSFAAGAWRFWSRLAEHATGDPDRASASIRTDLQPRLGMNSGVGLGVKPRAATL